MTAGARPTVVCIECREERPHAGHGLCQTCYHRGYTRPAAQAGQDASRYRSRTDRIEQEIAKGTTTRRIMDLLGVDYGVVKSVRDDMGAAS